MYRWEVYKFGACYSSSADWWGCSDGEGEGTGTYQTEKKICRAVKPKRTITKER